MRPGSSQSSPRSISLAVADLADADAIKTSIATSATAVVYDEADLNGAAVADDVATPAPGGHTDVPMYPSATLSSAVGSYNTDPIVFVGTYGGMAIERSATPSTEDGNETIIADGPMNSVTAIRVPAQQDTSGAFTFGFSGVGSPGRQVGERVILEPWRAVEANGTGNLHVGYSGGYEDTIPALVGQVRQIQPVRIFADSTATLTLYV